MKKTHYFQSVAPAVAGLLLLSACARAPADEADPAALDRFLAEMRAQEEADKAAAIDDARAEEEARRQASEERLDRFERDRGRTPAPAANNSQ